MYIFRAISLTFLCFYMTSATSATNLQSNIFTDVIGEHEAKNEDFDWGSITTYYSGESAGTQDVLVAVAIVNAGREIHPPHKHAEEEYLMLLEGQGTWTVKGKDFKAVAGDMLYAAPWNLHGIKNTGTKPLKFIVWKWNSKEGFNIPVEK